MKGALCWSLSCAYKQMHGRSWGFIKRRVCFSVSFPFFEHSKLLSVGNCLDGEIIITKWPGEAETSLSLESGGQHMEFLGTIRQKGFNS